MSNYAIIKTGGKQYVVKEGDETKVEKLNLEVGKIEDFRNELTGNQVKTKVINHGRHKKVRIIKFKNKTRSLRRAGHRQHYTTLEILNIQ